MATAVSCRAVKVLWQLALLLAATLAMSLSDRSLAATGQTAPQLKAAVSRIKQGGGNFDVALPLTPTGTGSGIECRAIPNSGLTLLMKFDQPISGGSVAISSGQAAILSGPTVSANTLSVQLGKIANAQQITIVASNVTSSAGAPAGSATVRLRVLEGDVNADGVVNQKDLDIVKAQSTKNSAVNGANYRSDANVSGSISGADVSKVKSRVGTAVPGSAAVNTPPSIGLIQPPKVYSGKTSLPIGFAVADDESDPTTLAVSATSSDQTLLSDASISITGTGSSRTVTFTPATKVTGTATVHFVISDGLTSVGEDVSVNVDGSPTLYVAQLRPEGAQINSQGSGFATLQLAADETTASLKFAYSNLSSTKTGEHIHGPANPGQNGPILFDIDTEPQNADGSYTWTFVPVGGITVQQQVDAIKNGQTYINIHTANYPAGEIRGQFLQVSGSQTFTPPGPPPALPGGTPTQADAARFLQQATFGPTIEDITLVQAMGFDNWVQQQLDSTATLITPILLQRQANGEVLSPINFFETWWNNSITAPDQLRQRVAFALSEILVVSQNDGDLNERPLACAHYYDLLVQDAFKNYRQILEDVTLEPNMGNYLDMRNNVKANAILGTIPNENFAREVNQLFSIGLNLLWPDGTLKLDANGLPIPSYDQTVVSQFARVFTGWNYHQNGTSSTPAADFYNPMTLVPANHETGTKALLSYSGDYSANSADRMVLPANQSGTKDLADALNQIFMHPNTGPFICRQLIQRLVTANPSPAYVYRVAQKFADNGQGVRGDMRAVVKAILTDYEARSTAVINNQGYGHLKEPLIRVTQVLRAFHPVSNSGYFKISVTDAQLQQTPLKAPTVFNFFEPNYVYPGAIANNGLVAPEFGVTDESQVVTYSNMMDPGIPNTGNLSNAFSPGGDIRLDLSPEVALASNTTLLMDRLNLLLMANNMSNNTRTTITNYLNVNITSGTTNYLTLRAEAAIHLIATSSEFCTQK